MADTMEILGKFWEALDDSPFVLIGIPSQKAHSEPMTAQFDKDYFNQLFFYARRDNRLLDGLRADPNAMLHFASKGHDFFACIEGRLSQTDDRDIIDRFWSPMVEAWFDGKDDPQLTMLRFDMDSAEMWEADVSLGKRIKGIFGGKITMEDMEDKHIHVS